MHTRQAMRGITLVECCVTIALAAIVLATAVPSWHTALERRRLEGTVSQLVTDIQFTRSEAVHRNEPLRMRFSTNAAGSCYVVHRAADSCTCAGGSAACTSGEPEIKTVFVPSTSGVRIEANVASLNFNEVRGSTTNGATVSVTSAAGDTLNAVVSFVGRVRVCRHAGSIAGYKPCR